MPVNLLLNRYDSGTYSVAGMASSVLDEDALWGYRRAAQLEETEHLLTGLPTVELAIAAYRNLKRFLAEGLRPVSFPRLFCVCQLKGKRHNGNKCERMPREDHIRGFRNPKTRERVLTHHPYFGDETRKDGRGNTLENVTADSEAFAARHGLTVRVSTEDWYFPTRALFVEYRVKKGTA